ncbi:MAG TPA: TonB family protein [Acidobacteriaceae bacterium]|jgi:protein TonB|nr:TonB family protein [Acidobacteriaceae bacterium]
MSTQAISPLSPDDQFRRGVIGAIALHLLIAAAFIGIGIYLNHTSSHWGENASVAGSIQASMVTAIPLPEKAKPVDKSVLTPDTVSPAPLPPPKEAVQPPPRPTDIEVKARDQPKKLGPVPTPAPPKHPQPPPPPSAKAQTGDSATQLPQSMTQLKNGSATLTVQSRTFGARYAYYVEAVGRVIAQNYYTGEVDPRSSEGKSVIIAFDIERDGSIANVHIQNRSGSPTLDTAAMRALQRIDTFGPLPEGDRITIEDKFDYKHQ